MIKKINFLVILFLISCNTPKISATNFIQISSEDGVYHSKTWIKSHDNLQEITFDNIGLVTDIININNITYLGATKGIIKVEKNIINSTFFQNSFKGDVRRIIETKDGIIGAFNGNLDATGYLSEWCKLDFDLNDEKCYKSQNTYINDLVIDDNSLYMSTVNIIDNTTFLERYDILTGELITSKKMDRPIRELEKIGSKVIVSSLTTIFELSNDELVNPINIPVSTFNDDSYIADLKQIDNKLFIKAMNDSLGKYVLFTLNDFSYNKIGEADIIYNYGENGVFFKNDSNVLFYDFNSNNITQKDIIPYKPPSNFKHFNSIFIG